MIHLSFFYCSITWTCFIYYHEKSDKMSKSFNKTIEHLDAKAATLLYMLDDEIKSKTSEIRLRVNKPLCITCEDGSYFISNKGKCYSYVPENPFIPDKNMMQNSYMIICNNSVYAYEKELANAFVTLANGSRVGIFGEALFNNCSITAYKNITSLNYRIPREIIGCAKPLINILQNANGIIICGPPSSSKTTILRDTIRMLASEECGYKRVAVIDARNEISATLDGVVCMDLGYTSDVINVTSAEHGIETAIRVMNPQYIALDEIMSYAELSALLKGAKCGVKLIATIHSGCIDDIYKKNSIKNLFYNNAIDYAVFIKKPKEEPRIIKLSKELFND